MLIHEMVDKNNLVSLYDSTNVKKVIYNKDRKQLMVFFIKERKKIVIGEEKYYLKHNGKFLKGSVYIYNNVNENIYQDFKNSESQGSFMNKIINRNYKYINKMKLLSTEIQDIINNSSIY